MNKKHNSSLKQNQRKNKVKTSIPRSLFLNSYLFEAELTNSVYLRTGQTSVSFDVASQLKYINIANQLIASNTFQSQVCTAGVIKYEFIQVESLKFTWYPSTVQSVTSTFEPTPFDFRYFACYANDVSLPSGYSGNFNQTNLSILLSQTSRPQSFTSTFDSLPYLTAENGSRPCLGHYINTVLLNSATTVGGIITMIQTVPATNSIALYNPKLGYLEIAVRMRCYNSIG
jgi:hypothetical protein